MDQELSAEQMIAEVSKDAPSQTPETTTQASPSAESHGNITKAAENYLDMTKYGKHEVEYKANGKPVRETLEQALNRSSQGFNYAQLVAEFKQKEPTYQKQIEELGGQLKGLDKYRQYDEYAKQNKAWADHVDNMWKNKEQFNNADLDPNDPITKKLASFEQALEKFSNQFGEKISKYDQVVTAQEMAKDDISFETEVGKVTEGFKHVDFNTKDESGKSVKTYVMEHMVSKQIPSFRTAFLDLYHDQLMAAHEQTLRDKHAKETQKRTKAGIIDTKSTPNGADKNAPVSNIGSKSWDELAMLGKKELGFM
jgi:hypothetical protein